MANKYANLVGTNKIKDEYTKINTGFDRVEADIDKLETDVTAVNTRVDTIITTPISGEAATQEIVDARVSAVKSKTFATLDARFEETEQDIATHMADMANLGIASSYGVKPTSSDVTAILNDYFDELQSKGIRYAYFDKAGDYNVTGDLSESRNILMLGLGELEISNPNNWYKRISKSLSPFVGKINCVSFKDGIGFKQFATALSEERPIKICFWGDSITTGNYDKNISLQTGNDGVEYAPNGITAGDAYSHRLVDMLTEAFPEVTFYVDNKAIGGTSIAEWNSSKKIESVTKSWIEHVKDTHCDLLIIGFGMNHSTYDTAKSFSYYTKKVLDYIEANFTPVPDIVFVTSPRPSYTPGNANWGTFEKQASREITAHSVRTYARSRGAYICDVSRLSDIKRLGVDFLNPIFKKVDAISNYVTLVNAIDNGDGTYTLPKKSRLTINKYCKDFTLKFTVTFANSDSPNYLNALTVYTNNVKEGFYDNRITIVPENSSGVSAINVYGRIADYTNWQNEGGYYTGGYTFDSANTVFGVTIEKRNGIVDIRIGWPETRRIRDYFDTWDVPGNIILSLDSLVSDTFEATISNLELFEADYITYLPTLTEDEMWGNFVDGNYNTKEPYGGNGVNHPSTKGLEECYAPALQELVSDILLYMNIYNTVM